MKTTATMNEEGYVNVADQLGLSGERGELSMFFCSVLSSPISTITDLVHI